VLPLHSPPPPPAAGVACGLHSALYSVQRGRAALQAPLRIMSASRAARQSNLRLFDAQNPIAACTAEPTAAPHSRVALARSHTAILGLRAFEGNAGRVVMVSAGLCPFGTPSRLSEPAPPMTAPCPPHRPRASTARGLRSASECSQSRRALRTPPRRWASTS
jgi:hypothetical protein